MLTRRRLGVFLPAIIAGANADGLAPNSMFEAQQVAEAVAAREAAEAACRLELVAIAAAQAAAPRPPKAVLLSLRNALWPVARDLQDLLGRDIAQESLRDRETALFTRTLTELVHAVREQAHTSYVRALDVFGDEVFVAYTPLIEPVVRALADRVRAASPDEVVSRHNEAAAELDVRNLQAGLDALLTVGTLPRHASLGLHIDALAGASPDDAAEMTRRLEAASAHAVAPAHQSDAFFASVAMREAAIDDVESPAAFVARLRSHQYLALRRLAYAQDLQAATSDALRVAAQRDKEEVERAIRELQIIM